MSSEAKLRALIAEQSWEPIYPGLEIAGAWNIIWRGHNSLNPRISSYKDASEKTCVFAATNSSDAARYLRLEGGGSFWGGDQTISRQKKSFLSLYGLSSDFEGFGFISAFENLPGQPIFHLAEIQSNLLTGVLLKDMQPAPRAKDDLKISDDETFLMKENKLIGTWLVCDTYSSMPKAFESLGLGKNIFVCPVTEEIRGHFKSISKIPNLEEYQPDLISMSERTIPTLSLLSGSAARLGREPLKKIFDPSDIDAKLLKLPIKTYKGLP